MLQNRNTPANPVPVPSTQAEANVLLENVNRGVNELRDRQTTLETQRGADQTAIRAELTAHAQEMANIQDALTRFSRPSAPASADSRNEERAEALNAWLHTGDPSKLIACGGWKPDLAVRTQGMVTRAQTGLAESGQFGGYVILDNFDREIDRIARVFSNVRAYANVKRISLGNTYSRATKKNGATARRTTESGTRVQTDAIEWAVNEITAHEGYADPVYSRQVMADTYVDLMSEVTQDLGEAYGVLEGTEFVRGTGVGEAEGFMAPAAGFAAQTGTTEVAYGKLGFVKSGHATLWTDQTANTGHEFTPFVNVRTALKPQYLANASYFMNRVTLGEVMLFKDANGLPIWQPSIQAGVPSSLRGYPVALIEEMDDRGAGKFPVAFGDMRAYYTILDRAGMDLLVNPYVTKGFITIESWKRWGAKVMKSEAMKAIKISA